MDRCELALSYHKMGYNCCQSVFASCCDLTGMEKEQAFAFAGGFGLGIGTKEELCGAASGAVMALSLLAPHIHENDAWEKQRIYSLSRELQKRFAARFGALHCNDIRPREYTVDERLPGAQRLGLTKSCEIFIVTAVELVEELKEEIPQR